MYVKQLASDGYLDVIREEHKSGTWGGGAASKAKYVTSGMDATGSKSLLDYGCGNGKLKPAVLSLRDDITVLEYDPAVTGKDQLPSPVDYVACIDVLEHVEPQLLDNVLQHIRDVMIRGGFLHPCLVEAGLTLKDGRNAHLIVEDADWWLDKIAQFFTIEKVVYRTDKHLAVYVTK
jgi:cyclopropane fatty-acyl-phospholipid synthase-like methyltransferase